jgi:hypothetical protein
MRSPGAEKNREGLFSFSEERLPVVLEPRPLARLAANPRAKFRPVVGGVSVSTGVAPPGTLGGVLHDNNGNSFAVTCHHVLTQQSIAEQPAQLDSSSAARIGTVVRSTGLISAGAWSTCNPYDSSVPMNELDISLIELDPGILSDLEVLDIGPIQGRTPKTALAPFLNVEVTGRSSGYRALETGGLAVVYRFRDPSGQTYCFRNLFQLNWPSFGRLILGRPVRLDRVTRELGSAPKARQEQSGAA